MELSGTGLRIDELAARAGVSVRTVRFYHQLGVLQRPEVVGRIGFYRQEHVERLTLVRRLQARGYSLAAISDSIATQVPAILLGEVSGTDPATAVWDGADPSKLDLAQLHEMAPGLIEQPELVTRMVELGLLVPEADERFTVPQPPLLRAGLILVSRGVPIPVALAELQNLRRDLDRIGQRFAGIVERDMLPAQPEGADATAQLAVDLLRHVWPAVLVAVGQVLTESTQHAVVARLSTD